MVQVAGSGISELGLVVKHSVAEMQGIGFPGSGLGVVIVECE